MPAPPQAAAVGYIGQSFSSTFTPPEVDVGNTQAAGFKFYLWNFFGMFPNPANIVLNSDSSVTLMGDTSGPNGELSTISYLGTPGSSVGTYFGNGAYFEATLKFNPAFSSSGWPSWWSMAKEHLTEDTTATQWPGQAPGYVHFEEVDFMEFLLGNTNQYISLYHDFYGPPPYTNYFVAFPQYVTTITPAPDFTQYHTYGCLWVPATASTLGYLKFYFDNNQVGPTYSWLQYTPTQTPLVGPVFTASHSQDDFGWQGNNLRQVIQPSLLAPASGNKIWITFGTGFGSGTITSCYIGHGSVSGTGGLPGSNLINPVFTGTPGAGNIPTGWVNTGIANGNTLITPPGGQVNGVTTLADSILTTGAGGFQGIQLASLPFSFVNGRRYKISAWINVPTGVTPQRAAVYFGGNQVQIASQGTLNAAPRDTYIFYTSDYIADGTETIFAFINSSGTASTGFVFALPSVQLYSIDPFIITFDSSQTQLTFNAGQSSVSWTTSTGITTDPAIFAYNPTKPLICAMHFSGSDAEFSQQNSLTGADGYVSVPIHTSAGNPQPDTSSAPTMTTNFNNPSICVAIKAINIQSYSPPAILDTQNLALNLGTGPGAPMTVQSVNVWQAPKPPTPTPPPTPSFNAGSEWQLLDRLSEPKPEMPQMPWL